MANYESDRMIWGRTFNKFWAIRPDLQDQAVIIGDSFKEKVLMWLRGHFHQTVDGSEITRPTTGWMVLRPVVNNGISTTNVNWWVDPGFLDHQQYQLVTAWVLPIKEDLLLQLFWESPKRSLNQFCETFTEKSHPKFGKDALPTNSPAGNPEKWYHIHTSQHINKGRPFKKILIDSLHLDRSDS